VKTTREGSITSKLDDGRKGGKKMEERRERKGRPPNLNGSHAQSKQASKPSLDWAARRRPCGAKRCRGAVCMALLSWMEICPSGGESARSKAATKSGRGEQPAGQSAPGNESSKVRGT
jgi:hypothetical protein